MIELNLYRSRIGMFHTKPKYIKPKNSGNCIPTFDSFSFLNSSSYPNTQPNTTTILAYVIYFYFIIHILLVTSSMSLSFNLRPSCTFAYTHVINNNCRFHLALSCVKYFFCILIMHVFMSCKSNVKSGSLILYKLYITSTYKNGLGRLNKLCQAIMLWLCIFNFLLITIVNPSLLNPGPTGQSSVNQFSVYYQNVQGLIPINQLLEEHPTLNTSKIHEISLHIYENSPDIVILNETWLKKSILDNEIIPTDIYKVERLDRSPATHPPDPNDPGKFRKNGGGILLGIKHNIDIVSKIIPVKCKAEILSIELTHKNGHKTIISSFYRVGTLGIENHKAVENYITKIRRRRNVKSIFIIGDMNLPNVNWNDFVSSNSVEQLFLDTFGNLSFEQLINVPTHIKGNILDYLVTDSPDRIKNLVVHNDKSICSSDHYAIEFNLSLDARRKKSAKRSLYNFKRANWQALNSDFSKVDWQTLLACDSIDDCLQNFETKFFELSNKRIPKIKFQMNSNHPGMIPKFLH